MMRRDGWYKKFSEKNVNTSYFVHEEVNIHSLFLLPVMNNMAVEEGNKLQNCCNVLTVLTKYGENSEKRKSNFVYK